MLAWAIFLYCHRISSCSSELWTCVLPQKTPHLSGLVVKASALRTEDSGLCWDYSGLSHTSDLQNCCSSGYPVKCKVPRV